MEKITPGQVGEMIALFAKKLPLTMPMGPVTEFGTAQYWVENPDKFESVIVDALMPKTILAREPASATVSASVPPAPSTLYPVADTNLEAAIALSEKFAKEVLGVTVDLRKLFNLPTELPWKNVLLIFDLGLDNRQAVDKAIKGQKLGEWEEENVMNCSGSVKSAQPTLQIIENSITPTADTLGKEAKSPNQLNTDGRTYLGLRGYAMAFGQRYFGFRDHFDKDTWTWFPKNRFRGGMVAFGGWQPRSRNVGFLLDRSDVVGPSLGARLAIACSLKT